MTDQRRQPIVHVFLIIWGVILEILASLCILCARAWVIFYQIISGKRRELVGPVHAAGKAPILLLHGLNMDENIFILLRRFLKRQGYGPIYTLNFGPLTWTLEQNAQLLQKSVETIVAKHGPLHVIAHSMGGLICRIYMQEMDGLKNLRSFTTMATPHFGTPMAHLGFSVPAGQMKPGSALIQRLNSTAIDYPKKIPTLYLYSDLDIIVPGKWGGALQPIAIGDFRFVPYLGHNRIFLSRTVFDLIDAHLSKALR